jgi:NifU-like protein involved in Fe-S cluster formation
MRYAAAVQCHFDRPANVGPLAVAAQGRCFRGEAGSLAAGTWVVFEADIRGGLVRRLAFQAFGCPHVIAACSRTTETLAGAQAGAMLAFDPEEVARDLEAPPEKLGRLLLIQDALRNCFRDWDTTQPAAAP